MNKIVKFLSVLFLFLTGAVAFAYVARNGIIKMAIDYGVTGVTGFETRVDKVHFDFPSTIHIQGLKINNPAGFKNKVFADLPEIYVSLDLPPLLRQERLHLREVRLHLQEIDIEKNAAGVSNISLLSSVGGTQAAAQPAKKPAKAMPFLLDRLVLTLRQVHFEDQANLLPGGVIPSGIRQ